MTAKCKVLQSHCKVVLEGSAVYSHMKLKTTCTASLNGALLEIL